MIGHLVRLCPPIVRTCLVLGVAALLMAASPPPWGDLSGWAGHYPTDRSAKPPRSLLQIPAIRAELHTLLSAPDLARLQSYAVEHPIDTQDGFLLASQCRPHDCGDDNAMVVIDLQQPRLWVGFFSRSPKRVSTRWFGTNDYSDLPESVIKKFQAQHEP